MSLLSDILKEVPLSSVLKEKIADLEAKNAALETEVAILKDELRKTKQENSVLRKNVDERDKVSFEIDETAQSILKLLAQHSSEIPEDYLASALQIHPTRLSFYLTELETAGYVGHIAYISDAPSEYYLSQQGKKYALSNNLL
jgi:predicted RNase H-like nuclease (RuvC/YqgF family)